MLIKCFLNECPLVKFLFKSGAWQWVSICFHSSLSGLFLTRHLAVLVWDVFLVSSYFVGLYFLVCVSLGSWKKEIRWLKLPP